LGVILYEIVYNRNPFQQHVGSPMKLMMAISQEERIAFPPIDDPYLADIMKRCLRFNAAERPTTKELLLHPYLNPKARQVCFMLGPHIIKLSRCSTVSPFVCSNPSSG
jgi:serine/threonine protein kinase